jgi:D-alanine-D-alanine ligase
MQKQKIRVAVLYGGCSGEHEVSLQSAAAIIKNLDRARFDIVPIGIDKQGQWLLNDLNHLSLTPELKSLPLKTSNAQLLPSLNQLSAKIAPVDVVFPVIHGTSGEDGVLQGLLEMTGLAYVGAGVLASAIGMDKDIAKRLAAAAGVPIPRYLAIKHSAWLHEADVYITRIQQELSYPIFVKPANSGSSVGIHKIKRAEDLLAAVQDAFLYDTKILIEEAINARELELSVLQSLDTTAKPLVSIPGEVVPSHEFYSYAAKYLDENGATLCIPANLTKEQIIAAQHYAVCVFEALDVEGMARVDLFLDKQTGQFYFNEINTIPGFTQISMYPKLWEASGLTYTHLLSHLIDLALMRHERKGQLKREWALSQE